MSTTIRPVTQIEDVDVNAAVRNDAPPAPLWRPAASGARPHEDRDREREPMSLSRMARSRGAYARQYLRVRSTATGMISRRPAHPMSTIITDFANGLRGRTIPWDLRSRSQGPRSRASSPTLRSRRAGARREAGTRGLDRQHERADEEETEVEDPEREDGAERPLVDDAAVRGSRHDRLTVQRLVELAP